MLHGIDTKREKQKQTLQDAQTNIICVLGTAPTFVLDEENKTLNTPVPVRNYTDLAKYAGDNYRDYTIYDAIDTIFQESDGATVYMINVFDETKHKTTVENEQHTPIANKFNISHIGLSSLRIKVGDKTGTEGEDYEVTTNADDCIITLKSEEFKNAQASAMLCSYAYADTTKVTAADFVGTVDADGNKTGAKAITNITQLYGDDVNIIIAPEFSAQPTVRDAINNVADDIKARTYLDAPKNTRVNAAIQGRKNNQGVDLMCSDKNAYMALPYVKRYNQFLDEMLIKPISPVLAGIRIRLNKEQDIAKSGRKRMPDTQDFTYLSYSRTSGYDPKIDYKSSGYEEKNGDRKDFNESRLDRTYTYGDEMNITKQYPGCISFLSELGCRPSLR